MSAQEAFINWHKIIKKDIGHIQSLLMLPLSDQPEALISDMRDIEAWNARCHTLLAEANFYLDRIAFELKPKKEGKTAFDLKTELDSLTAPYRLVQGILEGLTKAINQRLVMAGGILSYQRVTSDPVIRKPSYSSGAPF